MKNVFFSLAFMLIGSFAFANTNAVVTPKAETIEVVSENLVTKTVNHEVFGKITISMPESALNNNAVCGFPIYWHTDDPFWGSGSGWIDCSGGGSMSDIIDLILFLFF